MSDKLARALLLAALAAGAALRAWLALHDDGIYWPDEIYQSLEPAHRLVFGYGLRAWEFIEGARNWALPAFVAALLESARLLHLPEPRGYLLLVKLAFCAISLLTAWAAFRLSRSLGAGQFASALAAAALALAAPCIYFAPRALSESASALPLALGLSLALPPGSSRRQVALGGSLLGIATLLRLHNGLVCPSCAPPRSRSSAGRWPTAFSTG